MPRDVVALVSVEDFVGAVRVYCDRVHDLLRRGHVGPAEAVEVCESFALGLLDAVVNAPHTVVDLAGWWFARALELTDRVGLTPEADSTPESASLLAGTSGEEQVRTALATLPDSERAAVILRDAYDLPPQAVAVAIRRSAEATAALTAAGRLHLVSAYDGRRVPDLLGHTGRMTVDTPTLGRLADGSLEAPRAAPLRRHAVNCRACEEVLESLEKGRRLAAGLPIIAMPETAREDMLDAVEARAMAVLPSHDLVLRAVDEDHDPAPAVSPLLAIIAIALALVLGIAIALLTRPRSVAGSSLANVQTTAPAETPSFTPSTALTTTASASPSTSDSTSAAPNATVTSPGSSGSTAGVLAPGDSSSVAAIKLSPTQGPAGTTITVHGTGWPADTSITVTYAGGDSTTGFSSSAGRFTSTVTASGTLPGKRTVSAFGGGHTASATYTLTL